MQQPKTTATIPPDASLIEIIDKDIEAPMQFFDGLYVQVPVKLTGIITTSFIIEKRRDIKRVRHIGDTSDVIVSYTNDNHDEILQKLQELGITSELHVVKLPLWVPRSVKQRDECVIFWPMNNVITSPQLPIDPISDHSIILSKVITNKSIIIKKPDSTEIICEDISDCTNCIGNINHGMIRALGNTSRYTIENNSYLCNGLDVYCYYEPCMMCAMAMVHSRVGRLFYIEDNPDFGGIYSQGQIHCCASLNHRFRAFKLKMNCE
ncbi:cytidine deaminase-like protein [Histomonas meleagridis]|uniref:cytidine deaminase-like protein n=1 Tax=Histomonas meleagridis TaxID=135588 RepID=UPI003559C499|nr:cytidine deaminase-like protein [Histomonas meleagridis]KAH0804002.1 cytidine deaminase-like protein [Histomonas meleagridis]